MSDPLPLSLIVITRDAAHELAACIASAPFAAETVVVDSGSRDDTVAIARRAGARVVEHAFEGYGPQKNFAVAQAMHDWVLCIDADERVSPELSDAIRALFASGAPSANAYAMARRNRFLGRWLAHGEGYPDWIVRLFDRRHARWSSDPVHEKVVADGTVERLRGDLMHASGQTASALRLATSPAARFLRFYVMKLGFLDGAAGFAHIAIGAFASFLKYAKLRALAARARDAQ